MTNRFAAQSGTPRLRMQGVFCLCLLAVFSWVTGCSTSTVQTTVPNTAQNPDQRPARHPVQRPAKIELTVEVKLRQAARQWGRTPHQMGGLDRSGIDCSGLVKVLFRDLFNVPLPRTSRQQARQGVAIKQMQLKPGDLVFFQPWDKGSHVGIYLSAGQFLHVSTRRGVMISQISEKYWRNSYWTARRILPS